MRATSFDSHDVNTVGEKHLQIKPQSSHTFLSEVFNTKYCNNFDTCYHNCSGGMQSYLQTLQLMSRIPKQ